MNNRSQPSFIQCPTAGPTEGTGTRGQKPLLAQKPPFTQPPVTGRIDGNQQPSDGYAVASRMRRST